jgi:hypothetical protein
MAFSHHLTDMNLHGSLGHAKPTGNHFVGLTQAQVLQHFELTGCQVCRSRFQAILMRCQLATVSVSVSVSV